MISFVQSFQALSCCLKFQPFLLKATTKYNQSGVENVDGLSHMYMLADSYNVSKLFHFLKNYSLGILSKIFHFILPKFKNINEISIRKNNYANVNYSSDSNRQLGPN